MDDLFKGNGSSGSFSGFGGGFGSSSSDGGFSDPQSSSGGFSMPSGGSGSSGFGTPSGSPKGSGKGKKVLKVAGVTLGIFALSFGGFVGYKKYQQAQEVRHQEQIAQDRAFEELQQSMKTALFEFSTEKVSDTSKTELVSLWDLNLTYVSYQDDRANFAYRVSRNTEVELTKNSNNLVVKYPNWEFVAWVIKNVDNAKVLEVTKDLKTEDYTYTDDLINAFAQYLNENLTDMLTYKGDYVASYMTGVEIPEAYKSLEIPGAIKDGKLTAEAVKQLDELVFSSPELHKAEDVFSAVSRKSYGDLQESKAHADWNARFNELNTYITNLQGYLGIVPNKVKDALGNEVDEELTVENVEDITLKTALEAKQQLKMIEPTPYTYTNAEANIEKVMPYGWIGSSYISSESSDADSVNVRMGDGTYDKPITLGTPFITKMKGTDEQYHDVRVTVTEVLTGEDAMADVQKYDEKNNGFTSSSELVLGTVKFKVENLSGEEIEVNSEITLADKEQNLINRTGQMYSMPERVKIPPRGVAEMADWVYSKETLTINLMWGKTFNRQFDALFINALGNEVFDKYGRPMDRNTRKIVQNKAQADMDALKRIAEDEIKAQREEE